MDKRIKQSISLMQINLVKPLSVAKLAKSQKMSASRFAHLFREEVNITPIHYFKKLRLARAKELLEGTDICIKEIMALAGFNDKSHFVRDFRHAYGITPKMYRNTHTRKLTYAEDYCV